MKYGMF